MTLEYLFNVFGICAVAAPAGLLLVFGLLPIAGRPLGERTMSRLTEASVLIGLTSSLMVLCLMLLCGRRHVPIEIGDWIAIPEQHFHFHLKFVFDRLSVPFAILTYILCGTVGAFTSRYLHREPGYGRFFTFYALFLLGMILSSLAGTIETLFLGWELVGLSSALLVAFFHERLNPVRNGQWVWAIYRMSDAAFLVAALTLHHLTGAGDFEGLMGTAPWPEGHVAIYESHALVIGLLLLVAVAGKSALLPFSGWLPRAMEGPTPSSAIFYGALSVHLGAFLLLRVSPILELSLALSATVIAIGLLTAAFGALAAPVQSDIKSALAFASLTQVGIIVAEIGCGLRYLALVHIMGHACLRTLQLLRAPSLLHDYHALENAIGSHLHRAPSFWNRILPGGARVWFYHFAIEHGFFDDGLNEYIVRPFVALFRLCDRMERRWTSLLSGDDARESDQVALHAPSPEEFL